MNNTLFHVRRSMAMLSLAASVLIGSTVAWTIASEIYPVTRKNHSTVAPVTSVDARKDTIGSRDGFADVLEPVLPAVVNISSSKMVKTPQNQFPFFDDPLFRRFFGDQFGEQSPSQRREHSLGSGVIVNGDGYILTNNHVVDGATEIQVTLSDKRTFKAKIVGADRRSDVAVLKIPTAKLSSATFGNSSQMRVGDIVLAIGDPFGIGETATMGIVSATGRKNLGLEGPGGYEDFIQTDAAINPGNSGGALIDARGQLIGINTAIITSGGGGNQGIGFAIPIDMARQIMEQILKTGKVSRGYIGVGIQELSPELAKAFGLSTTQGALVGNVEPDGAGAKAGLENGDVITALNKQLVTEASELRLRISQLTPGTIVRLDVVRNGQSREVTLTLGEYPEKAEIQQESAPNENAIEGMRVETLTPDVAQELNLPRSTRGVVITRIDPGSPASDLGLQPGDVIEEINRKPVINVDQFRTAIHNAGNQPVVLLINRNGRTSYIVVASR